MWMLGLQPGFIHTSSLAAIGGPKTRQTAPMQPHPAATYIWRGRIQLDKPVWIGAMLTVPNLGCPLLHASHTGN